jgi:hypothetical protein
MLAISALTCFRVEAAKVCDFSMQQAKASSLGLRIAQIACDEHALWRKPYINAQGRIVRLAAMEGEKETLGDGQTPAWRRVAHYWKASGLLDNNVRWEKTQIEQGGQARRNGASDCVGDAQDWAAKAACRAFLIDVPWSAVFVSHVMKTAEISDFPHVFLALLLHPRCCATPGRRAVSAGRSHCGKTGARRSRLLPAREKPGVRLPGIARVSRWLGQTARFALRHRGRRGYRWRQQGLCDRRQCHSWRDDAETESQRTGHDCRCRWKRTATMRRCSRSAMKGTTTSIVRIGRPC